MNSESERNWKNWQPSDPKILVREATSADAVLLLSIYRSTREQELNLTPWDEKQKSTFIQSQFDAQQFHYKKYYLNSAYWIIEYNKTPAGRLYVDVSDHVRIIDIALLPQFRNLGLGSKVLKDVQEMAKTLNLPVSIHVEQYNPAKQLYKRLGFIEREVVNSIYILMEYNH